MSAGMTLRHRQSSKKILVVTVAAVLLGLGFFHFIGSGKIAPGLLPERTAAPNQPTFLISASMVPVERQVVGSIQSRIPIDSASRVAATVRQVRVQAGERVKRGQVLVVLDSADLRAQLSGARGQLSAAQAELVRTQADNNRFAALLARGSATQREFEAARAAYRAASARIVQARAAIDAASAALKYATVTAPVDGVVAGRMVEPGDLATPGKPLVRLYDEQALRVEIQVPEELIGTLKVGTPMTVSVDATGATFNVAVNEIVPETDPASRSFLVRAPMPADRRLTPGLFARGRFAVGSETAISIPRSAVEEVGQLDTVRVVENGRVETREVSLGQASAENVEVLAGLRPGDRILLLAPLAVDPR